jgi:hypothetical protein
MIYAIDHWAPFRKAFPLLDDAWLTMRVMLESLDSDMGDHGCRAYLDLSAKVITQLNQLRAAFAAGRD